MSWVSPTFEVWSCTWCDSPCCCPWSLTPSWVLSDHSSALPSPKPPKGAPFIQIICLAFFVPFNRVLNLMTQLKCLVLCCFSSHDLSHSALWPQPRGAENTCVSDTLCQVSGQKGYSQPEKSLSTLIACILSLSASCQLLPKSWPLSTQQCPAVSWRPARFCFSPTDVWDMDGAGKNWKGWSFCQGNDSISKGHLDL